MLLNNVREHFPATLLFPAKTATIFFFSSCSFLIWIAHNKTPNKYACEKNMYHLSIVPGSRALYPSRQPALPLPPTFFPLVLTMNPVISIIRMFSREILGRRSGLKRRSAINGFLPREAFPAVYLGLGFKVTVAVEEDCAHDNFVRSHDCLVVVGVGSAVGAVVAIYCVAYCFDFFFWKKKISRA